MGAVSSLSRVWIRKVQRNLQDHGLTTVVRKGLAYAVRPFYEEHVYRLYRIDLLHSVTADPETMEGVTFCLLTSADKDALQQIESHSEWLRGTVEKRLQAGALCLAALEDRKLVGFNLVSFGDVYMPLTRLHHRFRSGEAWSEQIAVVKDFRKKGLGANLRYRIFQELRRRGFHKLYGGALADNIPSLKLARRVGFSEFVDIRYRRILGWSKRQYRRICK